MPRALSVAALLAASLVVLAPTTAEPAPSPREAAKAAYEEAMEANEAGRYSEAARGFEAAYGHVPDVRLLWNIGRAWEKAGELERARDRYKEFLAHDDVDADLRDRVGEALLRVGAKIQAREAEAEQHAEDDEPPTAASGPAGSTDPGSVRGTYEPETTPPSAWSWVSLGLGVAAAGVGTYFLLDAGNMRDDVRSAKSSADDSGVVSTDRITLSRARALESDADTRARAGAATVVLGSALAVTGVLLAVTTGGDPVDPAVSFAATPTRDGGMLSGALRF